MSKTIQLQVPEPCHENWNTMTETDKGRFCLSCQKEVVDFSLMTDQQILQHISKAAAGVCGRFDPPQLNRDMTMRKERNVGWFKYVLQVLIPTVLISAKATAQPSKIVGDSIVCSPDKPINDSPVYRVAGGVQISGKIKQRWVNIEGKVTGEKGEAVPGATVALKGTGYATAADRNGCFSLRIPDRNHDVVIVTSSVGYELKDTVLNRHDAGKDSIAILLSESKSMGLMVVVVEASHPKKKAFQNILQPVKNLIDTVMNTDAVKVYPNPVQRGSAFNIDFDVRDGGEYNISVMNISGQPVLQRTIQLNGKKHLEQVVCDSRMSSGMYVVQVLSTSGKKMYAKELLVR